QSGAVGPDAIDQRRRAGDIPSNHADGLSERTLDQRNAVHQAFPLGNAATARAIHADRMHLIEIGHRAVLLGYCDDFGDRCNIAVHRVDALAGGDLRTVRAEFSELSVEVSDVAALPDAPFGLRMTGTFAHRGEASLVRARDATPH